MLTIIKPLQEPFSYTESLCPIRMIKEDFFSIRAHGFPRVRIYFEPGPGFENAEL
jgi:hypothetical protein